MGFDNECILNIQSLAGEYFCPVCRTLVYPHEALQTQCTHLYCKPCLSYVVSSTQACPYDGYLVTEAGSKPLMESNKALAETIGKTTVHCLYHRSGCMWQGPLSECTTHCAGCAFGNSPVVCNRCGIQIVHRQVQEHAQTCNVNGSGTAQDAVVSGGVSIDQSKTANQAMAPPSASQPQISHTATGPTTTQSLNQQTTANPMPQAMPAPAVPTPEQQYYQQYYQQYPGYDPYQQAYQQYYPYQQQPAQQVQQPPIQPQSQPQLQQQVQAPMPQVQPQPQNHHLAQAQGQPQPQTNPQAQSQIPANGQPQPLYPQTAMVGSSQSQSQVNSQSQGQPVAHSHMPVQSYSQVQPHLVQNHAQPPMQAPQYQQPHPQMHHPQLPQVQPYPQTQPQPYPHSHSHFQSHPQPQPQLQSTNPQHPLGGHPPYPSQPHQQIQHAPPQQHPVQVQPPSGSLLPQFPPPPPNMRPPQPPSMFPPQQRPVTHQGQQPMPPQYTQQPQVFPGQMPGQLQAQAPHAGSLAQQHLQVRPQVPPQPMQQPSIGFVQPQQGSALPHGIPPQSYVGRPAMLNQIGQPHQYPQSSGSAGIAPPARPPQSQSNANLTNQPHVYPDQRHNEYAPPSGGDQTFERRVGQEDKSPSLKKSEPVINDFGANFNEVKPEAGMNNELKPDDGQRKDGALTKDAVSELHLAQGVPSDSATTQRVKEESKGVAVEDHSLGGRSSQKKAHDLAVASIDSAKQGDISVNFQGSSQADKGPFSQSQITSQGQTGDVSGGFPSKGTEQSSHLAPVTEQRRSTYPPVPYGLPGQQQRPLAPMLQSAPNTEQTIGQSPNHVRPPGHGYLPHGPHPGEQFQPPGPNQPLPFHPELPSGGPNSFAHSRGNEQYSAGHGRISRMSQGDPLGPPPLHGPDGQRIPRHSGPMESDMYQNQRPPPDGRRQDSHLPGNVDRGHYGAESNSMRMNGAAPGFDSSSVPVFGDEKVRTDIFPRPPTRHREETFKQFPGPPHLGREDSPKFGSHLSRPSSGYGMDGPPSFHDKDPHGYGYDAGQRFPPYHPNESGGRPLPASIHDNRGRFDNSRQNPDFHGPMHGFGRHHMDHLPPTSPRNPFGGPHNINVDGRNMERQPFGERFPMGPPGHMHRGEFDGLGKPMNGEPFAPRNLSGHGEPGFGSFHDYGHSGEPNGPGGFPHQPRFGESFAARSIRPHLDEPVFRSSYSRQGFPSDGGFHAGESDSFDPLRKRKTFSMGWCRICKVDCETVEGLDMHGQTREHQRLSMDMVISIKKKNAKRHKTSSDREEPSKFRNSEIYGRAEMS